MIQPPRALQKWLWPSEREQTGVIIRIGRVSHWLGYALGTLLLVLTAIVQIADPWNHYGPRPIQPPQSLPWQEATGEGTWSANQPRDSLAHPLPDYMADAIPVSPQVQPERAPRDLIAEMEDRARQDSQNRQARRWNDIFEVFLVALASIVVGRLLR